MTFAVKRYDIHPTTIFGMHYAPTPFSDVVTRLHAFLATKPLATPR
jgi:hypothetical protein